MTEEEKAQYIVDHPSVFIATSIDVARAYLSAVERERKLLQLLRGRVIETPELDEIGDQCCNACGELWHDGEVERHKGGCWFAAFFLQPSRDRKE